MFDKKISNIDTKITSVELLSPKTRFISFLIDMFFICMILQSLSFFIDIFNLNPLPTKEIAERSNLGMELTVEESKTIRMYVVRMLLFNFVEAIICLSLFFYIWEKFEGYSPAKFLFNGKIVDSDTLKTPSRRQYIVRAIAIVFLTPIFCSNIFLVFFNTKNQALHDIIAHTLVIKAETKGNDELLIDKRKSFSRILSPIGFAPNIFKTAKKTFGDAMNKIKNS